ncbi:glycosyl transferase [Ramicandelaber brevisporus]|nr:glycosyl transferase [Ramicandelaber brevisporus]
MTVKQSDDVSKQLDSDVLIQKPQPVWNGDRHTRRANAALIVLVSDKDLAKIQKSIRAVEDRFNRNFAYPWIFFSAEPLSAKFKRETSSLASGEVVYAQIPKEQWGYPSWIDQDLAAKKRKKMEQDGVFQGGSEEYRLRMRWNAGFFFRHEALKGYDYYWRVEPDMSFFCDLPYDPFLHMKDNGYKYGYILAVNEHMATIETLWSVTKDFISKNKALVPKYNSMKFLSYNNGEEYNGCHFWSNFEIGDLSFFRSENYIKFFEHLDRAGGFFYERWGDAPVHSIALSMFLAKEQIYHFDDLGYSYPGAQYCPQNQAIADKCMCNPKDSAHQPDGWGHCTMELASRVPNTPEEYLRKLLPASRFP